MRGCGASGDTLDVSGGESEVAGDGAGAALLEAVDAGDASEDRGAPAGLEAAPASGPPSACAAGPCDASSVGVPSDGAVELGDRGIGSLAGVTAGSVLCADDDASDELPGSAVAAALGAAGSPDAGEALGALGSLAAGTGPPLGAFDAATMAGE